MGNWFCVTGSVLSSPACLANGERVVGGVPPRSTTTRREKSTPQRAPAAPADGITGPFRLRLDPEGRGGGRRPQGALPHIHAPDRPAHSTPRGHTFAWQYSVQLLTGALRMPASTPSVVMTKKGGKKYRCYLPEEGTAGEAVSEGDALEPALSVASYLMPIKGTCFYRLEGWWTYEFCFLRSGGSQKCRRECGSQLAAPTAWDARLRAWCSMHP